MIETCSDPIFYFEQICPHILTRTHKKENPVSQSYHLLKNYLYRYRDVHDLMIMSELQWQSENSWRESV
jgi:hypothetical protein